MKEQRQRITARELNPFSPRMSGYGTFDGTRLHSVYPPGSRQQQFHQSAHAYFREFIASPSFPCVAGQAVTRAGNYAFCAYPDMTSAEVAEGVCHDLLRFKQEFDLPNVRNQMKFMSFVAVFETPEATNQLEGAENLYKLLYNMHQHDAQNGFTWNETVSNDVNSPDFAYSSGGDAFFIPLLYPYSGSPSRRSNLTMVVFNAHIIFEKLRENGAFEKLKAKIRARQEWVHPHLGDHGEVNEFAQYSLVDPDPDTQERNKQVVFDVLGNDPFGNAHL